MDVRHEEFVILNDGFNPEEKRVVYIIRDQGGVSLNTGVETKGRKGDSFIQLTVLMGTLGRA